MMMIINYHYCYYYY